MIDRGRSLLVFFIGCCAIAAAGTLYIRANSGDSSSDDSIFINTLLSKRGKEQQGRLDELATEAASLKVHALPNMKPWMLKLFEGARKEQSRENKEQQKVKVEQREILSGKKADLQDPFQQDEKRDENPRSESAFQVQDLDLITRSKKSAPFAQALEHVQSAKKRTIKIIEHAKKAIIDLLNSEEKYVRQTASQAQTKYFDEGVIKVSEVGQHKAVEAKHSRHESTRKQEKSSAEHQADSESESGSSRSQSSARREDTRQEVRESSRDEGSGRTSESSKMKQRDVAGGLMKLSQAFDKGGAKSKQKSLDELLKIQKAIEDDYKSVIGKGKAARSIAKKFHLKQLEKLELGALWTGAAL